MSETPSHPSGVNGKAGSPHGANAVPFEPKDHPSCPTGIPAPRAYLGRPS